MAFPSVHLRNRIAGERVWIDNPVTLGKDHGPRLQMGSALFHDGLLCFLTELPKELGARLQVLKDLEPHLKGVREGTDYRQLKMRQSGARQPNYVGAHLCRRKEYKTHLWNPAKAGGMRFEQCLSCDDSA
jgi:hypothetical protein